MTLKVLDLLILNPRGYPGTKDTGDGILVAQVIAQSAVKGGLDFMSRNKTPIILGALGVGAISYVYWLATSKSLPAVIIQKTVQSSSKSTERNVFTDKDGNSERITATSDNPNSLVKTGQQGQTYSEFMDQQNALVQVGAAAANTLLADMPAGYGAWAADQTLQGVARAHNVSESTVAQNYANLDGTAQVLVALGQALTAPLGGGAATWGAQFGHWLGM